MKSHDNSFNPDSYFFLVIYVIVLSEPDALSSTLHTLCTRWFYTWYFFHLFFVFIFSRIYFSMKITYVTVSFTLPKIFRENLQGFQMSFLADRMRCLMCTEQYMYYQRPFVFPSAILETTTVGKIALNTITLMTLVVNANLTVVFGGNAF